jgi:transposase
MSETLLRFIHFRAEGRSFNSIAAELNVSKTTLIKWSRRHRFEIRNQRTLLLESLQEKWLETQSQRVAGLGVQLQKLQAELAARDITGLSTSRLFALTESLRRQIKAETGEFCLSMPMHEVLEGDSYEHVHWQP